MWILINKFYNLNSGYEQLHYVLKLVFVVVNDDGHILNSP